METKEEYPEWIASDNPEIDNFDIEHSVDYSTFLFSYFLCFFIIFRITAYLYMIDGDGRDIVYEKGLHYVNRIGICVLRRE